MIYSAPGCPVSRPRALCLDLSNPELFQTPAPASSGLLTWDAPPRSLAHFLYGLAAETGLLTVVLMNRPIVGDIGDHQTLLSQMVHIDVCAPNFQSRPMLFVFRTVVNRLNIEPHDFLCISDEPSTMFEDLGLRYCRIDSAVEILRKHAPKFRRKVFSGSIPMQPEMVHTTLLPLDLAIGTMADPHSIFEFGYRVFDVVLMIEGVVPLQGFAPKSLEKLVSEFAPFFYALAEDEKDIMGIFRANLELLRQAGCHRLLVACETGRADDRRTTDILSAAQIMGFDVELLSWQHLI